MTLPSTLTADRQVISPLHMRLLRTIAETEREYGAVGLRLEGGTALAAYHLHHRESEDLDVFGDPALDARDFRRVLEAEFVKRGLHVVAQGPASSGTAELFVSDQAATAPADQRQTIKIQICRSSPFPLEVRKIYQEVPDPASAGSHLICVIDESGEDYLFPRDLFVPVDLSGEVKAALLRAS